MLSLLVISTMRILGPAPTTQPRHVSVHGLGWEAQSSVVGATGIRARLRRIPKAGASGATNRFDTEKLCVLTLEWFPQCGFGYPEQHFAFVVQPEPLTQVQSVGRFISPIYAKMHRS